MIDESRGRVKLLPGAEVHSSAVLIGPLVLGKGVKVHAGAVIGDAPEAYDNPGNWEDPVIIGAHTVIREGAVIQRGLTRSEISSKYNTVIGDHCYIMHGAHVAHDCTVGHRSTMAPYSVLGGHCFMGAGSYMGINSCLHQHKKIGEAGMLGMGAVCTKDVPDGEIWVGNPARFMRRNERGIERLKNQLAL